MQTSGLENNSGQSDGRAKNLFSASVGSDVDVDNLTTQGFWICFIIAIITLVTGIVSGRYFLIVDALFFYLGGNGVRQRSLAAAVCVFVSYAIGSVSGFSILRISFIVLLLANVRGVWMASRWRSAGIADDSPPLLSETLGDKLTDVLPGILWPKTRHAFYILAVLEIAGSVVMLAHLHG